MRKIATVQLPDLDAVRLMIYDTEKHGVYVFGYKTKEDADCVWDCFFIDLDGAYRFGEEYGIDRFEWIDIPDPEEGCQHDRIAKVVLERK
ncbi:MAG: hypothetical protein K0S32_769 [Bacteroidetes bacterium]|jgi:hypothetical protein|nr:hypothetical protein [Bacteroidota bacterium]